MGLGDDEMKELLVVDDNPADIRLIKEAFGNSQLAPTIHGVNTSDTALDFVYQREEYADAPEPDAVFLDWNLAETTGKEVLDALKADYSHIPVVVMTGLTPETEPGQSSFSQADVSMEKSTEPQEYIETLCSLR